MIYQAFSWSIDPAILSDIPPVSDLSRPRVIHAVSRDLFCHSGSIRIHMLLPFIMGGGPRIVVSTAAHARVRGSFPGIGGLKETNVSSPSTREAQHCGEPS